jgi:hypothetical protein
MTNTLAKLVGFDKNKPVVEQVDVNNVHMHKEPVWYVLYGGESEDGRGYGVYKGRTKSAAQALTFYRANIKNNPHSLGYIEALDDRTCTRLSTHIEAILKDIIKKEESSDKRKTVKETAVKLKDTSRPENYGSFA